ncbi:MAG TPA: tryptophan-rich sensory protein [Ignavibacteria bacterium]|nr:tryptophan-rich sensory protein [Ignavibacteria bacterium]
MPNILKLLLSIIICQLPGLIGGFFVVDSMLPWYGPLNKPSISPPNWVFAPVWATLYLLMGISMFLIWKEGLKNKYVKETFILFIIQLVFNTAWTIVFFGAHSIAGGLLVIAILLILILLCIKKFMKISKPAAILLIPYLLWSAFAFTLNYFIFKLN